MKQILIIIDLIEEIVGENGKSNTSLSQVKERQIIARTNLAAQFARAHNTAVVWVKVGFADDYHDIPKYSPMFNRAKNYSALKLSSEGCHWTKHLDVKATDPVFIKKGVGAFAGNSLDSWLKAQNIQHICLGGVSSALAIESTARLAHDLGYKVTVLEDLCAAATLTLHEQSMQVLQGLAEIISTEQWKNSFKK